MFTLHNGDCLQVMPSIPSGSIDAIIFDPPYTNMVNQKWDNLTDEYYLRFFDSVKKESFRILRHGGRFISFSSNDTLKYLYGGELLHRELLVIDKDFKKVSGGRNTKQYKQHINSVEYVYVATKYAREFCREKLIGANKVKKLTSFEINSKLGVATSGGGMWSIYTGRNKCNQVPTLEQWEKFSKIFDGLPEYHTFEEYFRNGIGKGNILSGFNFRIPNRLHPTQKPIELLEYIINTYTRKNDFILDICMGSGTTIEAAERTGRNSIGIEKDEGIFQSAVLRLKSFTPSNNRVHGTGGESAANLSLFPAEVKSPAKVTRKSPRP